MQYFSYLDHYYSIYVKYHITIFVKESHEDNLYYAWIMAKNCESVWLYILLFWHVESDTFETVAYKVYKLFVCIKLISNHTFEHSLLYRDPLVPVLLLSKFNLSMPTAWKKAYFWNSLVFFFFFLLINDPGNKTKKQLAHDFQTSHYVQFKNHKSHWRITRQFRKCIQGIRKH